MLVTPVREVSVQDPFIRVSRGKSKKGDAPTERPAPVARLAMDDTLVS